MSWDSVEAKVETMLRTALKAATDSAGLTPRYHTFWRDSAAQAMTLPAVVITASPAVNDGWRTTIFRVPVEVAILTAPIDDPTGSNAKATYQAVRSAVEGATLDVSGWQNVAVTVESSAPPVVLERDEVFPGGLRAIKLDLMAEVAL